jgi:hypothetical protein
VKSIGGFLPVKVLSQFFTVHFNGVPEAALPDLMTRPDRETAWETCDRHFADFFASRFAGSSSSALQDGHTRFLGKTPFSGCFGQKLQ